VIDPISAAPRASIPAFSPPTGPVPLCVDLDGTLLRTDSLWEMSLLLMRRAPLKLLTAPIVLLFRGRASLKLWLAAHVTPDVGNWPLSPVVRNLIETAKAEGRRVVLVSGAPQSIVDSVARVVQVTDGNIGTLGGDKNLTGEAKAAVLVERFGAGGFDYVGNGYADMPCWRVSHRALAMHPRRRLFRQAIKTVPELQVLEEHRPLAQAQALVRAMRPHQWSKNVLVLAPVVAAHSILQLTASAPAFLAAIAFCLVASGIYLTNDLFDLEADRRHPRKRNRPLASGDLSIPWGLAASAGLLTVGLLIAANLNRLAGLSLGLYAIVSLLYSARLKRAASLDVIVLAGLYTIRILLGAVAANVALSSWFLAFSMFLFTSLAFVKRAAELRGALDASRTHGVAGRGYQTEDLQTVLALGAAAAFTSVLVLALYASSAEVVRLYHHPTLTLLLCPLLMYWLSRVWVLTMRGQMVDDPIVFALRDRISWLTAALAGVVLLVAS
jgi:4-hydroxybenzoate polyprenyltransferase/phosphoserine phosphatase